MHLDWLLSDDPAPGIHDDLLFFAPLIGDWSLVVENVADDGTVATTDAEWHFRWALGGHALLDVWISPARRDGQPWSDGEWGTSLRFHDEQLGGVRSTWIGPRRGWVIPFVGHRTGDGFRIESDQDGTQRHWIFSDVSDDAFRWRAEERTAERDWYVRQRFFATRQAS